MERGQAWLTVLVVILILLAIGLWFYPGVTKDFVTGAATTVKKKIVGLF